MADKSKESGQKNLALPIILAVIFGFVAGGLAGYMVSSSPQNPIHTPTVGELMGQDINSVKDFYGAMNSIFVDPHQIRESLSEGKDNFVLVDLRSREEYLEGHIKQAINIPAYADKDTPYIDPYWISAQFAKLPKDKDIVVYCHSAACMDGMRIGQLAAENGMYIRHLKIGWNEWKYQWSVWNHEHEWNRERPEDYISKIEEPFPE